MKVAILTKCYHNYNYGGVLQSYALWKKITEFGYESYIIKYDESNNKNLIYKNILEQSKQYTFTEKLKKISKQVISKLSILVKNDRKNLFEKFYDMIGLTECEYKDENLNLLNDEYNIFISGSDQVWNPNAVRNLYLQTFVNDSNVKASYAASIGRDTLSKRELNCMIPYLDRFDFISVREKTAQKFLNQFLHRNITVSLDPTLLIEEKIWLKITSKRIVASNYAFYYFFSNSLKVQKNTASYCKENDLKMVLLPYADQKFNLYDYFSGCSKLNDIGPKEFLSAIRYSDIVFTDSFHGVVFAIIFRKPFFVFYRSKNNNTSMNSRIIDLLYKLKLDNRMINSWEIKNLDLSKYENIDFDKVHEELEKLKKSSGNYLLNLLKYGEGI